MQGEQDSGRGTEDHAVPWVDRLGDALFEAAKRQIEAEAVAPKRCTPARHGTR